MPYSPVFLLNFVQVPLLESNPQNYSLKLDFPRKFKTFRLYFSNQLDSDLNSMCTNTSTCLVVKMESVPQIVLEYRVGFYKHKTASGQ